MTWDDENVWIDRASSVANPDGSWVIGNIFDRKHPGYSDDRRKIRVKYWVADPQVTERYIGDEISGGHTRTIPAHVQIDGTEVIEGVRVLNGCFSGQFDKKIKTFRHTSAAIDDPECGIDLRPEDKARWFLGDSQYASGITICRNGAIHDKPFARLEGFNFGILDSDEEPGPDVWTRELEGAGLGENFKFRVIMVFQGALIRRDADGVTHRLEAIQNQFAYVLKVDTGEWLPFPRTRCVVAYIDY